MMKKKYFINANIIDPHNNISEIGGLIIGEDGKIEGVGKKVNKNNIPSREKVIDLKENYIFFNKVFFFHHSKKIFKHAILIATPNSTCSFTTLILVSSANFVSISIPRFIGPGCIIIESDFAYSNLSCVSP